MRKLRPLEVRSFPIICLIGDRISLVPTELPKVCCFWQVPRPLPLTYLNSMWGHTTESPRLAKLWPGWHRTQRAFHPHMAAGEDLRLPTQSSRKPDHPWIMSGPAAPGLHDQTTVFSWGTRKLGQHKYSGWPAGQKSNFCKYSWILNASGSWMMLCV